MRDLSEFIAIERERYADEDNNLFAFSLGQALRYYEFVLIVAERHKDSSRRMVSNSNKLRRSFRVGGSGGPMTEEQMKIFEEGQQLMTLVHLDIESFYLFAKILLDKFALFLQNYFGPAQGISLASHDKLTKGHEHYRLAKGLAYTDGFSETLMFLKEYICDYRDKQISHLQNPRTIKVTAYDGTGQTRIIATQLYPSEPHSQVESKELPELLAAIDQYTRQIITVIESNRAKTRFRLKG